MAEPQYRLQTEEGLSKQYSLDRLIEKHSAGVVTGAAACTADDGSTWTSLSDLMKQRSRTARPTTSQDRSDSESASISHSETAVSRSAASQQEASFPQSPGRKLRRLPAGGQSKRPSTKSSPQPERAQLPASFQSDIKKPEDLIGVTLANERYTITGKLGKGSMAYVLRASDSRLLTDVVVKVPKPEKMTDADIRDRFRRESQLLVQLTHPHVVKVLDVGEYQSLPYVVMQLLSGGTLTDRVNDPRLGGKGMPPESLKTWLREVARALDFCYRKGMVHRDVKPANILFDEDENAYVSDFGLTKIMYGDFDNIDPSDTASGIVLGTPNYISPEIVLGRGYDGRADQYSLGITVYHTLFGKAPMQGDNATATMINQTQKRLQLLSEIRSDVPRELALAVRKSIEKKPDARFDTCEDFAEAVIEGLRAPVGKTAASVPASDWSSSAALAPPGSSGSGSQRRSSGSSRTAKAARSDRSSRQSSAATAGPAIDNDLDWLDAGAASGSNLPPRKGPTPTRKAVRNKAKSGGRGTVIFGQEVHPGLVIALTVGMAALVISIIVRYASTPAIEDQPLAQDFSTETYDATEEELAEGYAEEHAAADVDAASAPGTAEVNSGQQNSPSKQPSSATTATKNASSNSAANDAPPMNSAATDTTVTALRPSVNSDPPGNTAAAMHATPTRDHSATTTNTNAVAAISDSSNGIPFRNRPPLTVGSVTTPVVVVGNRVWNKAEAKFTATLQGDVTAKGLTALSADGSLFAAAEKAVQQTDSDVHVWNTQSGKRLFTAKGQPDRYVDSILLSSTRMLLGSRWKDTLQVWKTDDGKPQQEVKLPGVTIQDDNAAISPDGEFVAVVSNNQLGIIRAGNGRIIGAMRSPRARPGNPRAANNGQDQGNADVYAALTDIRFSPGGRYLAAVSTEPVPRILCWNNSGELEVDLALSNVDPEHLSLQWLADSSGWLVGNRLIDRETSRTMAVVDLPASGFLHLYDEARVFGRLQPEARQLQWQKVPFENLRTALKSIDATGTALSPTQAAGLQLALPERIAGADEIKRVLDRLLTRSNIRIQADRKDRRFLLHRPSGDDQLQLEFIFGTKTVWSTTLTLPKSLQQDAFLTQLSQQLQQTTIPWFVSGDGSVSLPVVIP